MSTKKNAPASANTTAATDAEVKQPRNAKTGVTASGQTFRKTRVVTVPVLKLLPNVPIYVRVEQAMEVSKQVAQKAGGDKAMEPAVIMHCTDLNTDDECMVIVGKALQGTLNDTYPGNSYVGKCFEIINSGKIGDKKYNTYHVSEVELDT